jgi:hypothetical protein
MERLIPGRVAVVGVARARRGVDAALASLELRGRHFGCIYTGPRQRHTSDLLERQQGRKTIHIPHSLLILLCSGGLAGGLRLPEFVRIASASPFSAMALESAVVVFSAGAKGLSEPERWAAKGSSPAGGAAVGSEGDGLAVDGDGNSMFKALDPRVKAC